MGEGGPTYKIGRAASKEAPPWAHLQNRREPLSPPTLILQPDANFMDNCREIVCSAFEFQSTSNEGSVSQNPRQNTKNYERERERDLPLNDHVP